MCRVQNIIVDMASLTAIISIIIISVCTHRTFGDPIIRNPLYETADYLNAEEREIVGEILTLEETQIVVQIIWDRTDYCADILDAAADCQCLQAPELFDIIGANTTLGLQEKELDRASVVLLYHLEQNVCSLPNDVSANFTYSDYLHGLLSTVQPGLDVSVDEKQIDLSQIADTEAVTKEQGFSFEQLVHILDVINQTYTPASNKCFTSDSVFHDIGLEHDENATEDELERLSSVLATNILHGECIGESHIVNPDLFVEMIFERYGTSGNISEHAFEHLLEDLGIQEQHAHVAFLSSSLTQKQRETPAATRTQHGILADNHDDKLRCYSTHELIDVFGVEEGITYDDFLNMCPALVEMLASGVCNVEVTPPTNDQSAIVYAWATIGVITVTLCSISGIVLVPLLSKTVHDSTMNFFIALAVSTLSGDALLHLLPESLGLHSHGEDGTVHAAVPEMVLGKVAVIVIAIYAFFLFERLLNMCLGDGSHGHSHSQLDKEKHRPIEDGTCRNSTPSELSFSGSIDKLTLEDTNEASNNFSFSLTRGMTSMSVMILVGDAVHNIMDGLAIGVAFTLDIFVGISTCIGIFCHEFPHEIGDFAVLVKNGLSNKAAFVWIIISNCVGLGGVYAGVALGHNDSLHQWMFAVTAGFFLYVSLVDLVNTLYWLFLKDKHNLLTWIKTPCKLPYRMPEITRDPNGYKCSVFMMHNIGLLLGWFLMLLLAYFEESISVG